jgi:flagellar hook assembly protein FlgD
MKSWYILVEGEMPAGTHEAVWDGRDASGRSAPSGSYLAAGRGGEGGGGAVESREVSARQGRGCAVGREAGTPSETVDTNKS